MDQHWSVGRGEEREDDSTEPTVLRFSQEGKAGQRKEFLGLAILNIPVVLDYRAGL